MGGAQGELPSDDPTNAGKYSLSATLERARRESRVALLADVKMRSPRDGELIDPAHLEDFVLALLAGPIDALTTVTKPEHFGGSLEIARRIRRVLDEVRAWHHGHERRRSRGAFPLVRKEFFHSVSQMDESVEVGFDAVQLTLRVIKDLDLVAAMKRRAEELGMEVIVCVHDGAELDQAIALGATIIGINNRDILALELDGGTVRLTEELMARVPDGIMVISESGLVTREDVVRAGAAGADAVLIGTAIARSPDPAAMVRMLRGDPSPPSWPQRRRE